MEVRNVTTGGFIMQSTGLSHFERSRQRGRALKIREVSQILGICPRTVWRLIERGELRSVVLSGRARRIFDQDLDDYLSRFRGV
jgi:excisionase family DNA binding protein